MLVRRQGLAVVGPEHTDVERPAVVVGGVVEDRDLLDRAVPVPDVWAVDDRELQALAAVDRQHLHGFGVGLEAAAAVLVAGVLRRLGDASPQPGRERRRPEAVRHRNGVQELADVAQIRKKPLTRHPREHPRGQAASDGDVLQQRRHTPPP